MAGEPSIAPFHLASFTLFFINHLRKKKAPTRPTAMRPNVTPSPIPTALDLLAGAGVAVALALCVLEDLWVEVVDFPAAFLVVVGECCAGGEVGGGVGLT
jgi:hypothetical protein